MLRMNIQLFGELLGSPGPPKVDSPTRAPEALLPQIVNDELWQGGANT